MGLGASGCPRGWSRTRPYELHPNVTLSLCTGGTLGAGPQPRNLTPLFLVLLFAETPPPPEQRGFMGPQGHVPEQGSPRRAASPATLPGRSPTAPAAHLAPVPQLEWVLSASVCSQYSGCQHRDSLDN